MSVGFRCMMYADLIGVGCATNDRLGVVRGSAVLSWEVGTGVGQR